MMRASMNTTSPTRMLFACVGALLFILLSCSDDSLSPRSINGGDTTTTDTFRLYSYSVKNVYPHASDAFTQGLVYSDGYLYEGTGQYGKSSIRTVDPVTGAVLQRYDLPTAYFGEGITIWTDSIIQLTWQSYKGFIYRKADLDSIGEFAYPYIPWGLTHDGERLIVSDGTDTLYFLDPHSFAETGRVTVFDDDGPVKYMNELEYIGGRVFANIYGTDRIAIIDPVTGRLAGMVNLSGLYDSGALDVMKMPALGVLNGIAYDEAGDRLFVTGKNWLKLFEIELVPVDPESTLSE